MSTTIIPHIISLAILTIVAVVYYLTIGMGWNPAEMVFGPEIEPGEYAIYTIMLRSFMLIPLGMSISGWDVRIGLALFPVPFIIHFGGFDTPMIHETGMFAILASAVLGVNAGALLRWCRGNGTLSVEEEQQQQSYTPTTPVQPHHNANVSSSRKPKPTTPAVAAAAAAVAAVTPATDSPSVSVSPVVIQARQEAKLKQQQRAAERIAALQGNKKKG